MLGKIIDFPSPTKKNKRKERKVERRKKYEFISHLMNLTGASPKIQDSVPLVRVLIMNPL